ncbi:MAG: DUF4921 family protein [Candidatus Sungbacteria bacterium]|nr:DUF4921 family protein [Candidatus Sungbacteria bacterium]
MGKKEGIHPSELRRDMVSGEWVVIATGRGRRPRDFASLPSPPVANPIEECPFETLDEENATLLVTLEGSIGAPKELPKSQRGQWFVQSFQNKYPAFSPHTKCPSPEKVGPHERIDGVGFHEVMVTRPHDRSIAEMCLPEIVALVRAYRARMSILARELCIEYISILHNHGPLSGASVNHPHSQLIAIPVVPPDIYRSLVGSQRYYESEKRCVHCVLIEFELSDGKRVIFENEQFVVLCPFASHAAFEIRIFPKHHASRFELMPDNMSRLFAESLHAALARLSVGLNNPSYNFFIHTAPAKTAENYEHYHWHLEILPKTAIWGGFEFGTGIEITTVAPEDAADFFRSVKI